MKLGNERMEINCVWGGSASSRITLREEFRHSVKVQDPETRRWKNKRRSGTHLEEKALENRVICLKQNNRSIVSLSIPEQASLSTLKICKASSKQSLPSSTSGSHTVDSDTASMCRFWVIAKNIRRIAEIIGSQLGQATINNQQP
jgi:hypothetical protein